MPAYTLRNLRGSNWFIQLRLSLHCGTTLKHHEWRRIRGDWYCRVSRSKTYNYTYVYYMYVYIYYVHSFLKQCILSTYTHISIYMYVLFVPYAPEIDLRYWWFWQPHDSKARPFPTPEASPSGSRADHSLHGLWQSQTPTGRMAGPQGISEFAMWLQKKEALR